MCAREASAHGLDVALLERAPSPGRKLCISGGGKANFTNRRLAAHHYACADPAFCEPALDAFTPQDMERLVHGWGLPVEERAHGQLFLTVPAKRLLDALVQDCRRQGCALHCQTDVHDVVPLPDGAGFEVGTSQGLWRCRLLVLALGSPAWPQCGATGSGFRLAQALGHRLVEHAPALAPFRMAPGWLDDNLAGISLPVRIGLPQAGLSPSLAADPVWQDDLLFTHDGISGPASLKASLFWRPGQEVALDFLPGSDLAALLDGPGQGKQTPRGLLRRLLPQRLVDALLPPETAGRKIAELSRAARQQICTRIHDFRPRRSGRAEKSRGLPRRCGHPAGGSLQPAKHGAGKPLDRGRAAGCHRPAGRLQPALGLGQRHGRRTGPGSVRGQIDIFHFYGGRGALEKAPLFLRPMP